VTGLRERVFFLLTLLQLTSAAIGEQTLRHRQELYVETSGETTYHTVVDYGPTRWFVSQEGTLLPPRGTRSPFTELRPPGGPISFSGRLLDAGTTTVGFSSPWLWFGPTTVEGGLSALDRPLSQGPFSAAWEKESGSSLAVGRDPPSRLGLGAALGPLSVHHLRTEELLRWGAVLTAGEPGEPGPWGELLLAESEAVEPKELLREPWFLDEPPLLARKGYHGALRGGINGVRHRRRLMVAASATPLDPPGYAAVAATTLLRRPWGCSVALVGQGYRNAALDRVAPGVSGRLERRAEASRGHTLGLSVRARRTGSTGAGGGGEIESSGRGSWKWRPEESGTVEPRWALTTEVRRERVYPEGETTWELALRSRPELRLRKQTLLLPLGWKRKLPEEEADSKPIFYIGIEGSLTAGAARMEIQWKMELREGEPILHTPALALYVSRRGVRRWQLGLRLGTAGPVSWRELQTPSMYRQELEGALFLRLRGTRRME
jgi:hypothetical protein